MTAAHRPSANGGRCARVYAHRVPTLEVNERHFEYCRANAHAFEVMAQYPSLPASLTIGGDAAHVVTARWGSSVNPVAALRDD